MRILNCERALGLILSIAVIGPSRAADPGQVRAEPKPIAPLALALTSQEPDTSEGSTNAKLLVREIARQAILIAARNELGLSTRDMTLRESMPQSEEAAVRLNVQITEKGQEWVRMRVSRANDEKSTAYEKELSFSRRLEKGVFDYADYLSKVEALSHTELVDALQQAGFAGEANRHKPSVEVPALTERQLLEMNLFSQFAALRDLHWLEKSEGESPQTLGALARGYANLGQLTNFHWNASHKAFKARALLYAQRLVRLDNEGPWSLWHRAYAEALAGLHAAAIEDLKRAATAAATPGGANRPAPRWVRLIDALCRYDRKTFEEADDAAMRELAALFSYLVVENTTCESLVLSTGKRALEVVPECYAICDSMGRYPGVINRHLTTVHGPRVLLETLPARLQEIPGLPPAVTRAVKRCGQSDVADPTVDFAADPAWAAGEPRAALVESLLKQGAIGEDAREPSWELLGRLLEDLTFVHVYRRLEFSAYGLGMPSQVKQKQWQAASALVQEHPYANVIKCSVGTFKTAAEMKELCDKMQFVDAEMPFYAFAVRVWNVGLQGQEPGVGQAIWSSIVNHSDHVAQDLEQVGYNLPPRPLALGPRRLRAVSPYSPQAIALLVLKDEEVKQPQMKQWEQEFGFHEVVLKALATRYNGLGQYSDAQRCLQLYVDRMPDQWGYQMLANVYWQQKQPEKWKESLEESLNHEDYALSHASTRVAIARYFMERKEWEKALPYADEAAESGAGWALQCAADCHEALEDWDASEQFIRLNAQRYRGSEFSWYFWCCRTGHGDVKAAEQLAAQRASQLGSGGTPYDFENIGVFKLLAKIPAAATVAFKNSFKKSANPYAGVHWALLAADAKDVDVRDAALIEILDRGARYQSPSGVLHSTIALAKWLNNAYHQPADAEPQLDILEEILKAAPPGENTNLDYFAGRYFLERGNIDLARKYLKRCVATENRIKYNHTLASVLLRELPAEEHM